MQGNKLDRDYQDLVTDILRNGTSKSDRTGTGTISVFGRMIRHDMSDGFPLLTTKKMSLKNIHTELYWFLSGSTNIQFLVQRGCNIWNGDAYKRYQQWDGSGALYPEELTYKEFVDKIKNDDDFANRWGELGPIYGKQWRNWDGIDQVQELIDTLRTNPDSRRMMVNAWNVPETKKAVLPPCHFGFQCYTKLLTPEERYKLWFKNNYETGMEYNPEIQPNYDDPYYEPTPERKLSLMWLQRSVDTGLGLPYNIASYGLLLIMLADEVGMIPDELIGSLGDTHLYKNHIAPIQVQLYRKPNKLPTVKVSDGIHSHCDEENGVVLYDYDPHEKITLPLSN